MVILVVVVLIGVAALGAAGIYLVSTRPCENGFHQRRHWRFRRFRPGGCSAVD